MTEDLDPRLQILFANSREELPPDEFAKQVMVRIDRLKRLTLIGRTVAMAVLIAISAMFAASVQEVVMVLADGLNYSIIEPDRSLLMQVLTPVNSVAGVLALSLIALQFAFRILRN